MNNITYSVVIPIYNEQEIIPELYNRLTKVLSQYQEPYEIIFIDDGGSDKSVEILKDFQKNDGHIKIISFSRNFGHQIAVCAGIDHASGDAVIIMDGDLQDPPEVLPLFIEKWKEGFEVVYGIRKKRKEFILKRMAYSIFYRLLKKISNVNIPLDSGDFSIIDKKIVATMKQMEERNRFVRGIRSWIGFRQTGLEYERDKRYAGEVKYTLRKLIRLAFDGLLSFSYVPLQAASLMGFIISFVSFFGILVVIFLRLFTDLSIPGFASTAVLILFLGGIQLITIGIIGEYVGRIYDEVKQRPLYIKKESIGFD